MKFSVELGYRSKSPNKITQNTKTRFPVLLLVYFFVYFGPVFMAYNYWDISQNYCTVPIHKS